MSFFSFRMAGKSIERFLRSARVAPLVYAKYKTFNPGKVDIPGGVSPLYINPHDMRAKKKLIFDPVRKRKAINRRFWADFVTGIKPDLALDIGANYGECVFLLGYEENTRAIAFEANPELIPYLERSRLDHPSSEQITVIHALVGDVDDDVRNFYVNDQWSGGSTAIAEISAVENQQHQVEVATVSVDHVLADIADTNSIVFKLDVEGYEPYVFQGMRETLKAVKNIYGFVEVDIRFLQKAGWTVERYQEEILNQFDLYIQLDKKQMIFSQIASLPDYCNQEGNSSFHFDLLLMGKGSSMKGFPDSWVIDPLPLKSDAAEYLQR